jgi:hypothetical protein
MVLNISTIEHLPNEFRISALQNLIDQINIGGHLILTFDYPDIDILEIENFFGVEIKNSSESIKNQHLSVVLLHLIKLQ